MAWSCRRCKILETNKYWHELPSDRHQFFKIMLNGFRRQLRIPTKFTMHFKEELANKVMLQGPSGNKWTVELTSNDKDLFFQNGWEKFALENGLEELDFLVFRYCGKDCFKVSIFNASGCERESAYYVEKHRKSSCSHLKMEEESVEIEETFFNENEEESLQEVNPKSGSVDEVFETDWHKGKLKVGETDMDKRHKCGTSKGKEMEGNTPLGERQGIESMGDETDNDSSICVVTDYQKHKMQEKHKKEFKDKIESSGKSVLQYYHSFKVDGKKKKTKSSLIIDEIEDEFIQIIDVSDDEGQSHTKKKQKMGKLTTCLPAATSKKLAKEAPISRSIPKPDSRKKKQANGITACHSSPVPSFKITMQHKNVCKDFIKEIPQSWAAKHIPKRSRGIQLTAPPNKNKWKAQIRYGSGIWQLTRGWSNFVLDNDLEKHDVCIFEIAHGEPATTRKPIVLDVFIHRAGGSWT